MQKSDPELVSKFVHLILDSLSKLPKEEKISTIRLFLKELGLKQSDFDEKDIIQIPASIFTKKLSSLESIVKYLKENTKQSFKQISILLNRDNKVVWRIYKNSTKKHKQKIIPKRSKYIIPIQILEKGQLTCFEAITLYLKDNYDLSFKDLSTILHRNYKTVWTVYKRGKNKYEKKQAKKA